MKADLSPEELALIAESLSLSRAKWDHLLRGDRRIRMIATYDRLIDKIVDARTFLTIVRLGLDEWREDTAGRVRDPDISGVRHEAD